jgi:phthiocerol/phenolphthiocerol synthesis type-I polyketide synthase D
MIQRLNTQTGVNYKPQYFPGSITLFQASIIDVQPELGWDKLAQDIETVLVPGDHYSMVDPPHVEILAQLIQESLERSS